MLEYKLLKIIFKPPRFFRSYTPMLVLLKNTRTSTVLTAHLCDLPKPSHRLSCFFVKLCY